MSVDALPNNRYSPSAVRHAMSPEKEGKRETETSDGWVEGKREGKREGESKREGR